MHQEAVKNQSAALMLRCGSESNALILMSPKVPGSFMLEKTSSIAISRISRMWLHRVDAQIKYDNQKVHLYKRN